MILHGGDSGELNHHFKHLQETVYIFNLTHTELKTFDFGQSEILPTLEDLLEIAANRVFLNIEVKAPHDREKRELYDYKESIRRVHGLIKKYNVFSENVCVSSFDHDILEELETLNQLYQTRIEAIYLYNYYDSDELPHPDVYTSKGLGINISSRKLTREVVEACHAKGKIVGVWIDKDYARESEEFYKLLLDMGVDFFCSDYPDLVY